MVLFSSVHYDLHCLSKPFNGMEGVDVNERWWGVRRVITSYRDVMQAFSICYRCTIYFWRYTSEKYFIQHCDIWVTSQWGECEHIHLSLMMNKSAVMAFLLIFQLSLTSARLSLPIDGTVLSWICCFQRTSSPHIQVEMFTSLVQLQSELFSLFGTFSVTLISGLRN